jgi:hypothetical protein
LIFLPQKIENAAPPPNVISLCRDTPVSRAGLQFNPKIRIGGNVNFAGIGEVQRRGVGPSVRFDLA